MVRALLTLCLAKFNSTYNILKAGMAWEQGYVWLATNTTLMYTTMIQGPDRVLAAAQL